MRRAATVLSVTLVLTLAGCYTIPPRADPTPAPPSVEWDAYDPSVKTRIDELAGAGDCASLQDEFDIAEANTSDDRANLMAYIDYQLEAAGCYT